MTYRTREVTDPNAPVVFVAFQLFASGGPGAVGKRQNLTVYSGKQRIIQRIQFLLRRLLDFERVFNHAGGYASGGWPGIARKECPFPSRAIQTRDHPLLIGDKLDSAHEFISLR
jgi:hypothetical protein